MECFWLQNDVVIMKYDNTNLTLQERQIIQKGILKNKLKKLLKN